MHSASPTQVVRGLEAIIDAAAGVLAEQSLTATLNGMARALKDKLNVPGVRAVPADNVRFGTR